MLPYILVVLCFSSACEAIREDDEIRWPARYTIEATRISLTSGVIEEYKAWKANGLSRIDYNNGAVKTIVHETDTNYSYGVKYEIHHETTHEQFNVLKCFTVDGTKFEQMVSEDIFPSTVANTFTLVENEPINDENSVKFFYNEDYNNNDVKHTLWAKYDDEKLAWIPVRYEMFQYNTWSGSLSEHELWNFYNFNYEFNDSVFSTDTYECTKKPSDVTLKTKKTTMIDPNKKEHIDHVFETFKKKFNKIYEHQRENAVRRAIFKKNLRLVLSTNRRNLGYKLTINHFADRTPEEMKRYQGLRRRPEGKVGNIPFPYDTPKLKQIVTELPAEYDLRDLGYISEVKSQEDCGSCWTFGTTSCVEGALARSNGGRLKSLSNQALVDCAWAFGAGGCGGGTDNAAYEWMMRYGLPTEAEYGPYLNSDGLCHIQNMTELYPIRGYTDVTPFSVEALKVATVNHGPLSVSVHVTEAFSLYTGGIFYDTTCNPTALNHEVTLVGYGERDGETFWILKNSWGSAWGIDGYMFISTRDNNCGVTTEPTYVVF